MVSITERNTIDKDRIHLEFVLVNANILYDIEMVFGLWIFFLRLQYGVLLCYAQKVFCAHIKEEILLST
jgi:hypothetical protein